jgi:hypothetical protein
MVAATSNETEPRSTLARFGVAALNLLTPGLGLIRLGRLRAGLLFAFGPIAAVFALVAVMAIAPAPTPLAFLVVTVGLLALAAFVYLGSILASWHSGRHVASPIQWWRRWYSLLIVIVIVQLLTGTVVQLGH